MADLGSGTALPGSASNGDTFFKTDVQQDYIWVSGAWAKLSAGAPLATIGPTVAVVSTRPASAGIGQAIFALDTNTLSVWTGTAWKGVVLA